MNRKMVCISSERNRLKIFLVQKISITISYYITNFQQPSLTFDFFMFYFITQVILNSVPYLDESFMRKDERPKISIRIISETKYSQFLHLHQHPNLFEIPLIHSQSLQNIVITFSPQQSPPSQLHISLLFSSLQMPSPIVQKLYKQTV